MENQNRTTNPILYLNHITLSKVRYFLSFFSRGRKTLDKKSDSENDGANDNKGLEI